MIILVTGDRNGFDINRIKEEIIKISPSFIIVGDANGVDNQVYIIAKSLNIPVEVYNAEWYRYNKAAGPIRNELMIQSLKRINQNEGKLVLAFHSNIEKSKGTKDCISRAKREGIEVKLFNK